MIRPLLTTTLARVYRRLSQWQQRRAPVATSSPDVAAVRERVHARVAELRAARERQNQRRA